MFPESCDYLIVGGGATGMAFADTLLKHFPHEQQGSPSVVMVDKHPSPGGQWHDSYGFVRLHQPSAMYGVETEKLEPAGDLTHRATRLEVLDYYDRVQQRLASEHDFQFVGGTTFDIDSFAAPQNDAVVDCTLQCQDDSSSSRTIRVRKRVVDARFLEPDLPIFVAPKFTFNAETVTCVPVNSLDEHATKKHYVVIGAGKTGMDTITYLQEKKNVIADNIMWVVPNEAWITARENIGSCMEFLHTCCALIAKEKKNNGDVKEQLESTNFFQDGFLEWEKQGKVYRFHKDILPTKFKDATLCQGELSSILNVKQIIRNGRVQEIGNKGELHFVDGSVVELPSWDVKDTLFVHCSAGAFHYTKQAAKKTPAIFDSKRIMIQDVYGTPGFCFVGSIVAMLECVTSLSDKEKNLMLLAPQKTGNEPALPKLGPSGGDIGVLTSDHGFVQRVTNLKKWLGQTEIREFLVGHRLFNLGQYDTNKMDSIVQEIWDVLSEGGIVPKEDAT